MKQFLLTIICTALIFGSIGFLMAEDTITPLVNTQIISSTASGSTPLIIELDADVADSDSSYVWTLSNGADAFSKQTTQIFSLPGEYIVSLETTSSTGAITNSQIKVIANDEANCSPDYDDDGLNNCDDLCPLISGVKENTGCPILSTEIPEPLAESCNYRADKDYIFGNAICNTCPCKYTLSYNAQIRPCDILFPAITSADKRNIYQRGDFFEVR